MSEPLTQTEIGNNLKNFRVGVFPKIRFKKSFNSLILKRFWPVWYEFGEKGSLKIINQGFLMYI